MPKLIVMKKLIALLLAAGAVHMAVAQSSVTSVNYNKTSQPALMLELPYTESISEGFIIDNLKKTGYDAETKGKLFWKQNKMNGFYIFKEVRLEGASKPVDLYFKVDPKSKREKNQSIIYLLVGKGEDNFISSGSDEQAYNAAKTFLNGFITQSAVYKLDLDIKNQEEVVTAAEKKLDKLKENEKEMARKIEQLQKDIKKSQEDQKDQEKTIDNERKKLDDLKSQTKNG
jgi:hypothetical protein